MAWVMLFTFPAVAYRPETQRRGELGPYLAGIWARLFPPSRTKQEQEEGGRSENGRAATAPAPASKGRIRGRGPAGPSTREGPQ